MRCLFYFGLAFCFSAAIARAAVTRESITRASRITVSCLKCNRIADVHGAQCLYGTCKGKYGHYYEDCKQMCENHRLRWNGVCDYQCPPLIQELCKKITNCKKGIINDIGACLRKCPNDDILDCVATCKKLVKGYYQCEKKCLHATCFDNASTRKHCPNVPLDYWNTK